MATNNIGAAHLQLGQIDEAEASFQQARSLDPTYPLPCFNLAVIAQFQGEEEKAKTLLHEAQSLGMKKVSPQSLVDVTQALRKRSSE